MIAFLIRVLIFDFVFSFAVGVVLLVIMLPFAALSKSEQPGTLSYAVGIPLGMALCAVQGIMIAAAVVVAIHSDPSRWAPVWYVLGFAFSVPIAIVRSLGDPEQSDFAGLVAILSSNLAYVLACIFPQHIPPFLGNTAVRLLL